MELRLANSEDIKFLWELRNESAVRQVSLNTKPIPLGEHKEWFSSKMSSDKCFIFIVIEDRRRRPIGQVRLDALSPRAAEISIALVKSERGKGLGLGAIRLALDEAKKRGFKEVTARIKDFNDNSLKAFTSAKFEIKNSQKVDGNVNLVEMTKAIR